MTKTMPVIHCSDYLFDTALQDSVLKDNVDINPCYAVTAGSLVGYTHDNGKHLAVRVVVSCNRNPADLWDCILVTNRPQ